MKNIPIPVCIIGLVDGIEILLIKRKKEPYKGYWGLVGGKFELGESIEDVIRREVMEETGFSVGSFKINGMYNEILLDKDDNLLNHFLFVAVKVNLDKNVKRKNVKDAGIESSKWFNLPLKDNKNIIPSDLIMLENFNSDIPVFKEFVMKEDGDELKLVEVVE
jgi:ADP-ribose pyrophosphatase YjhB (NUDIX family)